VLWIVDKTSAVVDNSSATAVLFFVIFAPLFSRKAGNGFFIEKKASFRLSV